MLKLKVGQNFLYTPKNISKITLKQGISFMMSNLTGKGKLCYILESGIKDKQIIELSRNLRNDNINVLYVLTYLDSTKKNKGNKWVIDELKNRISFFRQFIYSECPNLKMHFIKMDVSYNKKVRDIADNIIAGLMVDKNSILSHYDILDDYKTFKQRMEQIPAEIKAIDEGMAKLRKGSKVCERKIGLKTLEPLKLIKNARVDGGNLILTLYPQKIKPSEKLGTWISESTFQNNKYIRRVAELLYQGYDFGIKETIIRITSTFKPEFIDTVDHGFDYMMRKNNWSSVGFLHFGKDHLCGGEFNDVIARAKEYGLEYYFIAFKQYITTANVRDYAGKKVWWYPIYDDDGKIIYCAALDIYKDFIPDENIRQNCENMTWEELLEFSNKHTDYWNCIPSRFMSSELPTSFGSKTDHFIEYCKNNNVELYNRIIERNN